MYDSLRISDRSRRTGERYEGDWKDGIRHGKGRRYYSDGSIYDGGWDRDKKHGKAQKLLPHGIKVFERYLSVCCSVADRLFIRPRCE